MVPHPIVDILQCPDFGFQPSLADFVHSPPSTMTGKASRIVAPSANARRRASPHRCGRGHSLSCVSPYASLSQFSGRPYPKHQTGEWIHGGLLKPAESLELLPVGEQEAVPSAEPPRRCLRRQLLISDVPVLPA